MPPIPRPTQLLGHTVWRLDSVPSTNDVMRDLIAQGRVRHGDVVVAGEQTSGRGRQGRTWRASSGSALLCSVFLTGVDPRLTYCLVALAVRGAIDDTTGLTAEIKWPNDLLIAGYKVCGILIDQLPASGAHTRDQEPETRNRKLKTATPKPETRNQKPATSNQERDPICPASNFESRTLPAAIVGVGVNSNMTAAEIATIGPEATSLAVSTGGAVDDAKLLEHLLRQLEAQYIRSHRQPEAVFQEWRSALVTLGQEVEVETTREKWVGLAVDVADDGALLVRNDRQLVRLYAADVRVRPNESDAVPELSIP